MKSSHRTCAEIGFADRHVLADRLANGHSEAGAGWNRTA